MKIFALLFIVMIGFTGCTQLSDAGFDRAQFTADASRGSSIQLADYTAFDWDRVDIFAPYTPSALIEKEVGSSVPFPHAYSESHCLLVFLSQGKRAAAFEVERTPVDFAGLAREDGYTREEASFNIVTRTSDGWKSLRPKPARR